ncbi:Radical SAM domain protein [Desulfitobacterium hafniense DCB-2]|uniref:Radical SAM domain protein n=2 Tax=Desulfitobacterium hafniense TaxID=49338 RepID=B8FTU1_DESHD|nr:Radical SAM domain protein [Desulfitobacterium hafniense DCB-2]
MYVAVIKPSYDTNRTNLRDVIPLSGPFGMYIEPTRICNMRCFYCMHATRGDSEGALAKTGFKLAHMDMELYDKIIDGIMKFPDQPKRVTFSGLGEPLTNPKLGEMARRLRKAGFTGRNDIITNGLAFTPRLADELVDAGINRIQISVQGLTSEAYSNIAGVSVDIGSYIENIAYLYKHKKNTEIFIKIIDANLEDESEKARFFEMFSAICDTIFVEHLVVMEHQMGDHGGKTDRSLNLNGEPFKPCQVCGIMFYFFQINIDGDTFPCSTPGLPTGFSMGNIQENTLQEIWDGKKRNSMLRTNLRNGYRTFAACRECSSVVCITDPAERLDDCREEMLKRLPE